MYGHAYIVTVTFEDGHASGTVPLTRREADELVSQAAADGLAVQVHDLAGPEVERFPVGTRVHHTANHTVSGVVALGNPSDLGAPAGTPPTAYWAQEGLGTLVRVHVVYDVPRASGRQSDWWPGSYLEVRP